jgi:hypothetical protein
MKAFAFALIYVGFYSLIALVCYFTASAWPLLALMLSPSVSWTDGENDESKK